jgi:hypothetical protein
LISLFRGRAFAKKYRQIKHEFGDGVVLTYRLSTDHTSRTLYNCLWSAAGVALGDTTALILHWFSAGVTVVPGVPQTSSISFICFTDIKLRSHWPSVMPSARVLIRLPLHVNFSVEAAFASAIALKTSAQMQPIARRLGMLANQKNHRD